MTSDKTQRDALKNQRVKDTYVHASQEPWIQWYPGIDFKMLRATQETVSTPERKCINGPE